LRHAYFLDLRTAKKTVTDLNITNYIHKTHRKSSSITHWKSTHYKKHKNRTVQIHI